MYFYPTDIAAGKCSFFFPSQTIAFKSLGRVICLLGEKAIIFRCLL
jgi:hypothetical protein